MHVCVHFCFVLSCVWEFDLYVGREEVGRGGKTENDTTNILPACLFGACLQLYWLLAGAAGAAPSSMPQKIGLRDENEKRRQLERSAARMGPPPQLVAKLTVPESPQS